MAVEARNLPSFTDKFHYMLDIKGKRERVQARFLNNKIICPQAMIHPLRGPIEGGMQVTIEGTNLETSQEIYNKVKIGGIPCISIEYNFSVRVVCRTGVSGSPLMVDMVVGIRAGITKGQEKFQYQQVMVRDIQPCTGPQSRGTRLYISGLNLDIGNNLTPYLDILPCTVDKGCRNMMVTGRNQPRMAVLHKNQILKETVLMELEGDLHCRKIHLSHKLLNMAGTFEG